METSKWDELMKDLFGTGSSDVATKTITEPSKIKTIKDVQKFLGSIGSINSGGCGIAAYSMYLWLKKQDKLPKDFNIVYLHRDYDEVEFKSNKAFLEGKSEKIHSCVHAVVRMDGKHIDSKGTYDVSRYPFALGIGSDHIDRFMVNSLNKPEWNPSFNRGTHMPEIERVLGVDLSEVLVDTSKQDKPKMKRHYRLKYWNKAADLTTAVIPFKNYKEAYKSLQDQDLKILSVKYVGWRRIN